MDTLNHQHLRLNKFPNYYGPQRFGVDGNVSSVGRFLLSKNYRQAVSCLVGSQRLQNSQNLQETILNKAVRKFEESDFLGAKELWPNTWLEEQKVVSSLAKGNSSEKAIKSIPFVERNFFGSAFQSQLFNECLSIRLELDHFNSLLQGDIAVSDKFLRPQLMRNLRETEENKLDFSVNPSGPIYGE